MTKPCQDKNCVCCGRNFACSGHHWAGRGKIWHLRGQKFACLKVVLSFFEIFLGIFNDENTLFTKSAQKIEPFPNGKV